MYRLGFSNWALLVVGIAGCGGRYTADRGTPALAPSGSSSIATVSPVKTTEPASGRPVHADVSPYPSVEDEAVAGIVMSALSFASNPDYYREDFVTGRCLCRFAPGGDFELPCANVVVALSTADGRELTRIFSSDGEFVFAVDRQQTYTIRVYSNRYVLLSGPGLIKSGDDVALHLGKREKNGATAPTTLQ